jgi:hypothetical protein
MAAYVLLYNEKIWKYWMLPQLLIYYLVLFPMLSPPSWLRTACSPSSGSYAHPVSGTCNSTIQKVMKNENNYTIGEYCRAAILSPVPSPRTQLSAAIMDEWTIKDNETYMSAFPSNWPVNKLCGMCLTDFKIDWRYIHSWFVFLTQLLNGTPMDE